MRRTLVLLLLTLLTVGACTGSRNDARSAPAAAGPGIGQSLPRGTTVAGRAPNSGAQGPGSAAGDIGPVTAHVPAKATTVGVIVLHSYGHTDAEPVKQGWSAASDKYGFVAIYPSRSNSWNAGLCCGPAAASDRDDVSWLVAVIADARQRYGLQTVYLAGFSNGGMMAERLVAEHPEVADRLVTWGSAPEMPHAGRWTGASVLYTGEYDNTVPAHGGVRDIAGRPTVVRAGATTGWWLTGGPMKWLVVPDRGHEPPKDWPELAWRALHAPPGTAPHS